MKNKLKRNWWWCFKRVNCLIRNFESIKEISRSFLRGILYFLWNIKLKFSQDSSIYLIFYTQNVITTKLVKRKRKNTSIRFRIYLFNRSLNFAKVSSQILNISIKNGKLKALFIPIQKKEIKKRRCSRKLLCTII